MTPVRAKAPFRIHQFGGSLGGPLQKDRAFFFVSYDGQRQTDPEPGGAHAAEPAAHRRPTPRRGLAKVAAGRGRLRPHARPGRLPGEGRLPARPAPPPARCATTTRTSPAATARRAAPPTPRSTAATRLVRTRSANASLASVFSPTFFNELRVAVRARRGAGAREHRRPRDAREPGRPARAHVRPQQLQPARDHHQALPGRGHRHLDPRRAHLEDRLRPELTTASSTSSPASSAATTPSPRSPASTAACRAAPASPSSRTSRASGTTGAETQPDITEFALFLQDEWRLRKNVTLSLGLRYDVQSFAKPEVRNPDAQLAAAGIDTSFLKTDKNNVAPRLGLVYKPNDQTLLRGGLRALLRPHALDHGGHRALEQRRQRDLGAPHRRTRCRPTRPCWRRPPPASPACVPSIFFFDPDYENPEVHQWSARRRALAVERPGGRGQLPGRRRAASCQRTRDFNIAAAVPDGRADHGRRLADRRPLPDRAPLLELRPHPALREHGRVDLPRRHRGARKRFSGGLQANLSYTLGKVEDTKPDATAVVPGQRGRRREVRLEPARPRGRPRRRRQRRAPPRGALGRVGHPLLQGLGHRREGAPRRLDALHGSPPCRAACRTRSGSTNDLNNDGNRFNDIVPGSRNTHRLPTVEEHRPAPVAQDPAGRAGALEIIARGLQPAEQHEHHARSATRSTTSRAPRSSPQLNLANPRLELRRGRGRADQLRGHPAHRADRGEGDVLATDCT